jgi:hypothetical protein
VIGVPEAPQIKNEFGLFKCTSQRRHILSTVYIDLPSEGSLEASRPNFIYAGGSIVLFVAFSGVVLLLFACSLHHG